MKELGNVTFGLVLGNAADQGKAPATFVFD
jgi:hypothetical protein